MKLYTYFRSSAAFRVRIVLNLKQVDYESIPIHLVKNGGEHLAEPYLQKNPMGLVPCLEENGSLLTQSGAICEYLNEAYPEPPLLPAGLIDRAWVRSICNTVACDIHPINNLRILNYLTKTLGQPETARKEWYHHWIQRGFSAMETQLSSRAGRYCLGDELSLADAFVTPQVFNALRFHCPMNDYPTLQRIYDNTMQHAAFERAAPVNQADAE